MIDLRPPLRSATPDDAAAMAELVNFAGDGLALYLWGRMSEAGQDPWEIGRQRAQRETGGFSYRNTVVVEENGKVIACLIGYALPDDPEPIDYATMPPMFVALQELENLAPATWYVNVVAAYPEHRGRGLGTMLLRLAQELAADTACKGLSIIVSDANTGARRLYERTGYKQIATRPAVKEDWKNPVKDWVLLVKQL